MHMTLTSGPIGNRAQADDGAAEPGIAALSKQTALELKRRNVRSNGVAPFAESQPAFCS